jgi:Uma2 family endonuclease
MRIKQTMQETARLITAEEFEALPGHDHHYELVMGRLVPRMSPVGLRHGEVVSRIILRLMHHTEKNSLGLVGPELGVKLTSDPDTVRGPDVAFVRRERIPATRPRGFFVGAPDLAVEVLSPDDRPREVRVKVENYLEHGTTVVLVVDPDHNSVTVFRRAAPPIRLNDDDDVIDLDDAVPGFRCTVREIFE